MTLWRLVLVVVALSYAGFGFAFFSRADEMAEMVKIAFATPAARTDFRATYGGLEFGLGVFLLLCALRREFVRIGLFAAACALIAMATARTTGIVMDGFDLLQFMIALTEWGAGALSTWGAVVAKPEKDAVPIPLQDATPDEPPLPPAA